MSTRSSARDRQSAQDQIYEYDENTHIDPEPADSQIVEVDAEVLAQRSNVKKTQDIRWTKPMEEKLIQACYFHRGYIKTTMNMQTKWENIKGQLCGDRDFDTCRDKGWEAFQRKFGNLLKSFKNEYAYDKEGANLSRFDPAKAQRHEGPEKVLYDIYLEIENSDEAKKEKSKKEKARDRSCLRIESAMLSNQSMHQDLIASSSTLGEELPPVAPTPDRPSNSKSSSGDRHDGSVASALTNTDGGSSVKSLMESFLRPSSVLDLTDSPSKEQIRLKTIEAENEQLRLKLQLEQSKMMAKKHNDMMLSFCDNMDKLTAAIQGKRYRRPTEEERQAEYREMEQELADLKRKKEERRKLLHGTPMDFGLDPDSDSDKSLWGPGR